MKLEDQVVSLELAKKLKELGVKQESYAYWYTNAGVGHVLIGQRGMEIKSFSAFTVAELGEIMKGKGMGIMAYSDMHSGWWVSGGDWDVGKQRYKHTIHGEEKWADCLAKMLIYLLENNLTKK